MRSEHPVAALAGVEHTRGRVTPSLIDHPPGRPRDRRPAPSPGLRRVVGLCTLVMGCAPKPSQPGPDVPVTYDAPAIDDLAAATDALHGSMDAPEDSSPPDDAGEPDAGAPVDAITPDVDPARPDSGRFDPCPATPAQPCLLLPLGDSITFGSHSEAGGGYRRFLDQTARAARRSLRFVGSTADAVGRHDGHPGAAINDVRTGFPRAGATPVGLAGYLATVTDGAARVTPHVVLLMIGANDVREAAMIRAGSATRLASLLDELTARLPGALVVVAQITPNLNGTNDANGVVPYNAAVAAIVEARRRAGRHVTLVDMHSPITRADLSDDLLHPIDRGYRKIAAGWYRELEPLLRAP